MKRSLDIAINILRKAVRGLNDKSSEKKLHRRCASLAKDCIVEIGVMNGDTTKILLEAADEGCCVVGIDPLMPDPTNGNIGSRDKIRNLEAAHGNFLFIKDYSYHVAAYWKSKIDYLFVDADHSYQAVTRDFLDWLPHVKRDGYIALHDSAFGLGGGGCCPGPTRLAKELMKDKRVKYITTARSITLFKKW